MATARRKYKTEWQRKKRQEIREERAAEGDPVKIGRPRKQMPFVKDGNRINAILNAGVVALRDMAFDGNSGSWRLFKWRTTQEFLRDRKKTTPSDAELLFAFNIMLTDGYVLPTSYSRRGFPLEVSRSVEGESF